MRDVWHNNANLNKWHLGSKPLLRKTYYYELNRVVRHYNADLRKQYLPQKWPGWHGNARGDVGSSPPRTYNPRMNSLYRLPSRKAFHHLPNNLHSFNLLWYLIRGLSNLEFLLSSWPFHRFESKTQFSFQVVGFPIGLSPRTIQYLGSVQNSVFSSK